MKMKKNSKAKITIRLMNKKKKVEKSSSSKKMEKSSSSKKMEKISSSKKIIQKILIMIYDPADISYSI